ncbi:MAG: zinc-dependent dehydrogenase [Candidatus Omnitrophica bacterium]|nr:zinc-dependent dehydrogenase [Candidatus Omnitrophota bacterium]
MRVAKYYNNRDVRLEEMPKPEIGAGEILVKVRASGICGTDVLEWYRLKKAPLVLGHEITGEIAKTGAGIKRYKIGQRVFVSHHVPCYSCRYCRTGHHTACETLHTTNYFPGGFAEYIRVPKINVKRGVFVLPKEISFEEGTFIEPLACVIRGQRLAGLKRGQNILILGSGISGLLHLLLAREKGAGHITVTDINSYRLNAARKLGADVVIDARKGVSCKADLVIVCTGAMSAFRQAIRSADRGGTVLFFACTEPGMDIALPINEFWRNEMKLLTSYANSPQDAREAIELIRKKKIPVKKLITHRLGLRDAKKGFQLVVTAKECIKVIIEPHRV